MIDDSYLYGEQRQEIIRLHALVEALLRGERPPSSAFPPGIKVVRVDGDIVILADRRGTSLTFYKDERGVKWQERGYCLSFSGGDLHFDIDVIDFVTRQPIYPSQPGGFQNSPNQPGSFQGFPNGPNSWQGFPSEPPKF